MKVEVVPESKPIPVTKPSQSEEPISAANLLSKQNILRRGNTLKWGYGYFYQNNVSLNFNFIENIQELESRNWSIY